MAMEDTTEVLLGDGDKMDKEVEKGREEKG